MIIGDGDEYGVSIQGTHPNLLPQSAIFPDVFHLGCAIGKRLLEYLPTFSLQKSERFQNKLLKLVHQKTTDWNLASICL